MVLAELLKTMRVNDKVNITLIDSDDNILITFNCKGYEAVESDIQKRAVSKIKVDTEKLILVYIEDAAIPSV